ncbi:MAG TPA: GNAT family N-acetyltransferase [Candidatus Limnocylindrales bacterium]|nr:GNAT family N-acetyltransferase [Candidatus Limnocylindrales bacterium]
MITLRRADLNDAEAVADIFLRSFGATYDFPLAHSDDDVREWARTKLIPQMETWVAVDDGAEDPESDGMEHVVGLMTLAPGWLEQLYVDPTRLGEGIGRMLLDLAKELQPNLLLWTFQVNERARRFYERNGFSVVRFGDESNNEEHQPDVQYIWKATARSGCGRRPRRSGGPR